MRKSLILGSIFIALAGTIKAQDIYTSTGGEMIFQMSQADRAGSPLPTNLRWTVFLHMGQYVNVDFNNNFGLYTGLALRNVGFIMNEHEIGPFGPQLVKHIFRTYNLGVPLVLKFGSLTNHLYFFGGVEYEWQFHLKHKYWPSGNGSRSNEKVKYTSWFTDEVRFFVPSVMVGVQFPEGINLKFKYYLQEMLNKNYVNSIGVRPYEDLNVKLFYLSLSVNINNRHLKKKWEDRFNTNLTRK